jgi:hypothetical protein
MMDNDMFVLYRDKLLNTNKEVAARKIMKITKYNYRIW